jgi:hypothetical protein
MLQELIETITRCAENGGEKGGLEDDVGVVDIRDLALLGIIQESKENCNDGICYLHNFSMYSTVKLTSRGSSGASHPASNIRGQGPH